jgi:hypothetical protein
MGNEGMIWKETAMKYQYLQLGSEKLGPEIEFTASVIQKQGNYPLGCYVR